MTRAVYVAAGEAESNKGTVALGMVELLSRQVGAVGGVSLMPADYGTRLQPPGLESLAVGDG